MKFRKLSLLPLIMLGSITLSSCYVDLGFIRFGKKVDENTFISKTEGYYKGYDLELENADLETELQEMCFDKHKNYVLYSQYNTYCMRVTGKKGRNSIEAIADGSTINQYFYTGKEAGGYGTREHVWPCANSAGLWSHDGASNSSVHNVDYTAYVGGGSDLFHVRTCNTTINTMRGNSKFVDFDDPEFEGIRSTVVEKGEKNGKYNIKLQGLNADNEYANKNEEIIENIYYLMIIMII